jgi:hypothetical protein
MIYNIWVEGFSATGQHGPAQFIASVDSTSFKEACIKLATPEIQRKYGNFNETYLTLWGCKLFDNEVDARRNYG